MPISLLKLQFLAQLGENKYEFVRVEDFATVVRIWRNIPDRSADC